MTVVALAAVCDLHCMRCCCLGYIKSFQPVFLLFNQGFFFTGRLLPPTVTPGGLSLSTGWG